jgi:hypothetical protein
MGKFGDFLEITNPGAVILTTSGFEREMSVHFKSLKWILNIRIVDEISVRQGMQKFDNGFFLVGT